MAAGRRVPALSGGGACAQGAAINDAKKILADECTRMLHGADVLPSIHETAAALFKGGGGSMDDLPTIEVPSFPLPDSLVVPSSEFPIVVVRERHSDENKLFKMWWEQCHGTRASPR